MKSKPDESAPPAEARHLRAARRNSAKSASCAAWQAHGINLAKNLGNTPSNICTPEYLAGEAKKVAKAHGFGCEILDYAACDKLGMGSFLSVAKAATSRRASSC
jgi:leucyl aminopeptidase